MSLKIQILPLLVGTYDNYAYLLKDTATQKTAVIDPSESEPVLEKLKELNWPLNFILNTHHHWDHTGGNEPLVLKTGAEVVGFSGDHERIPMISMEVTEKKSFSLGESIATIIEIPGHTTGHIAFYFKKEKALFCGDTLFSLGCGRLFEGTPEIMWESLKKLRSLSDDTQVFCGHEYTLKNSDFALTVEPDNQDLIDYTLKVKDLRSRGLPSIPSTIEIEKKSNPFFRADILDSKNPVDKFAELRKKKDSF